MLAKTALQIVHREKSRYVGVAVGVALAVFLVLLQSSFYLGFRRDITIIGDSFDADLWVSQRGLLAFDYVAHFDDLPRWQALGDPDVLAVAGVVAEWARFRRTDGATDSAQVVGIDFGAGVNVDLGTEPGLNLASTLALPGNVLVDEKHRERFGVSHGGEVGVELRGRHASEVC